MVLCDIPYAKSQTQEREKVLFLNIQFWIQEIIIVNFPVQINGKNVSSDHAKNLTFKMFSAFQKRTYPPSFLWAVSRSQILRTIYCVKEAEHRRGRE